MEPFSKKRQTIFAFIPRKLDYGGYGWMEPLEMTTIKYFSDGKIHTMIIYKKMIKI